MLGALLQRLFSGFGSKPNGGDAAGNAAIRAQLAAMGDDGTAPRHVLHYVYPHRKSAAVPREEIAAFLAEQGFDTVRDAANDGGFVMEHEREVASAAFDEFTSDLAATLSTKGWEYDGWECAVVTEEQD